MIASINLPKSGAAPAPHRVVELDPSRDRQWEVFLGSHPEATIYHHPVWLQLLCEAFGYRAAHLACEDARGRVLGILPLFRTHGILTGRRLSSLPRTPLGGPLALTREATAVLLDAAVERTREERCDQLQLKVDSDAIAGLVDGLVGGPFRPTYVLRLPCAGQPLCFGSAQRRHRIKGNVEKAARKGVVVREAESQVELKAWYRLYLETMRRRCIPPRPYLFFELAWHYLRPRGMLRLLLAEQRTAAHTRLLSGGVFLHYGQTVAYAFQGSREDALDLRPNDALQWHAILEAQQAGFTFYDLGEVSTSNAGLAAYKEKWGAQRRWLYRYYYGAAREREIDLLDSQDSWHHIGSVAWQRMPLAGTEMVSGWLHKHI